jgi:hypothetical protein
VIKKAVHIHEIEDKVTTRCRSLMEPVAKPSIELLPLHGQLHPIEEEIFKGEETGQKKVSFGNSFAGRLLTCVDKIPENALRYRIKCHPPHGEFDCSKIFATSNDTSRPVPNAIANENLFLVRRIGVDASFYLRYPQIISITVVCLFCADQRAKIQELLTRLNLIPVVCSQLALSYL